MNVHPRSIALSLFASMSLLTGPAVLGGPGPDDEILQSKQVMVKRLLDEKHAAEALPICQEVLTALEERDGEGAELAHAYHVMGGIQYQLARYAAAEQNVKRALELVAASDGEFSPNLNPLLRDLASIYYTESRFDDAEEALRREQHIMHREGGVHTLAQLNIIDSITAIKLRTHQFDEADRQQRFYYEVNASNYGESDERMLPVIQRLGRWFRESGQLDLARRTYHKLISLMKGLGHSRLDQVEPLQEISGILYVQGACCAVDPLEEVVEIVSSDPATDEEDRGGAFLQLADMNVLERKGGEATELYHRAWEELTRTPSGTRRFSKPEPLGVSDTQDVVYSFRKALARQRLDVEMDTKVIQVHPLGSPNGIALTYQHEKVPKTEPTRLVGSPVPLCYPQVMDLVRGRDFDAFRDYYMDLEFSVNPNGRVEHVEVRDSNTPRRLAHYVRNMLREIRFRPRLDHGEPVATEHIVWHQEFTTDDGAGKPISTYPFASAAMLGGCRQLTASR